MRWILIPVIDGSEEDTAFLEKASAGTGKAILAFTADANTASAARLKDAESLVQRIKLKLSSKPFSVIEYIGWGEVVEKIESIVRLEGVTEVVMPGKPNPLRQEVAARLNEKAIKVTFY